MLLENDILQLRALEATDLPFLYKVENDSSFWKDGNTLMPVSHQLLEEYILQTSADIFETRQTKLMLVLKATNTPVGLFDLFHFDPHHSRIEMGVYIDKQYRQKGYAASALMLVKDYVFQFLGVKQLYAVVSESNLPCRKLLEKGGFAGNGTLKSWTKKGISQFEDAILYQCIND